jgi:hypothetical protein
VSALANEFRYSEAKLAAELGIHRLDIKSVRDRCLKPNRDWKKVAGTVAFNNRGLRGLWRELDARPASLDLRSLLLSTAEKNGAAGEALAIALGDRAMPIPMVMRVTRIPENPCLILVHDEHRRQHSVWVGRNENFVIGMQVKVGPHLSMPGMLRLLGPLPRLRGRWM